MTFMPSINEPASESAFSSSSSISTEIGRTNSLVLAGLPPTFFYPDVLDVLREHFAAYGEIYAWAPIRSFSRVIIVYYSEESAESAKRALDNLGLEMAANTFKTVLRVYRADPMPIPSFLSGSSSPTCSPSAFSPYHLRPPEIERNFFISPPGSPPVGWEQIREEPPNNAPLAEDLILALRRLKIHQEREQHPGVPAVSVLIEPEEGAGIGVYVEDCGDLDSVEEESNPQNYQEEGWFCGGPAPARLIPVPTMRPPMPTSV